MTEYSFFQVGETCDVVVPDDYEHDTYLSEFRKQFAGRHGFFMASDVNGKNYPNASQRLVPGMRLHVSAFGVKATKPVRISKCITFLVREHGVFTNAHGLALAYQRAPGLFEKGFSHYGLDVCEMLPSDQVRDHTNKVLDTRYRHPLISVPNGRTPMPVSFTHALTEQFGTLARFLKFEVR